ncbi:pseudouridylate synthase 7 homolog [Atheta coriaria]|uniref:pseudouridylate synthase 7 homolog n=1 Tax=Dalotia coriaria TaxID=877792 RepID=UPI0031F4432B
MLQACSLILKPKDYDNPLAEITQAKKIYAETQNAQDALQKLSSNQSIESKLIHGLAKFGKNDFVNALECIPRNMRLMYIHAFQSLIWNQVASKRVKDFGLNPVVGDLVYLTDQEENEFLLDDTKGLKDDDAQITEENEKDEDAEIKKQLVKVLSEEDLSNYTIYDVVLPMPGYDVTYPENLKDYYVELLGKHKLELEMPKQRVKCYTLSGTYRKIVSKPEELAWHTIKYNDPIDTLIRSDFEEILGHKEPVNNPDGKFKGLVVSFKLKSSSYATMVLREILKIDTATINPSKFQQNTPKVDKTGNDTVAAEAEGSLMQDKDKYDAFKRLIEGDGDDDEEEIVCMKRPAEDVEVPSKKAKVDEDSDDDTGIKMQPSLV